MIVTIKYVKITHLQHKNKKKVTKSARLRNKINFLRIFRKKDREKISQKYEYRSQKILRNKKKNSGATKKILNKYLEILMKCSTHFHKISENFQKKLLRNVKVVLMNDSKKSGNRTKNLSHFKVTRLITHQWKNKGKVCQCLSHRLHRGGLRAGRCTSIEIVADERRRVYSTTRWVKPKSAKALRVRREERQVTLGKWKERLSGSSKGEWTRLLIRNLDAWLERGHRQMNFYLTQVMSGQGAFNAYLHLVKIL